MANVSCIRGQTASIGGRFSVHGDAPLSDVSFKVKEGEYKTPTPEEMEKIVAEANADFTGHGSDNMQQLGVLYPHMTKPRPQKDHTNDKGLSLGTPKLFLLDVEGTIAPLSLVYEQLFPYARAHFERYLQQHAADAGVVSDLTMLAEENAGESDEDAPKFATPEYWDEAIPYLNSITSYNAHCRFG